MGIRQSFVKQGYLILDTSYFNHYMIGRAYNVYKEHFDVPKDKKEVWKIDFSKDDNYVSILTACYIKGLNRLLSQYNISRGDIIFATDCKRRNIWRIDLFPDYKIGRFTKEQDKEGINKGPVFNYINTIILPLVLDDKNYGFKVSNPYAEGDDVIAVCKNYLREKYETMKLVVITNDSDFLQIRDDHTILENIEEFDLYNRSRGNPKMDLLHKVLRGDKGDDIPSCFVKTKGDKVLGRGCGDKTAEKLIANPELLKEKFRQYPDAVKQYRLNRQLIDFAFIPDIIKDDILKSLSERL